MLDEAEVTAAIRYLEHSGHIRQLQSYLREAGAPSGRSWEDIRSALVEGGDEAAWAAVTRAVREAALFGMKSVRLFHIQDTTRDLALARTIEAPASLSVALTNLTDTPTLVDIQVGNGSTTFVYRSRRGLVKETPIDESWVKEEFRSVVAEAEAAYIVGRKTVVAFDCVEVPHEKGAPIQMRVSDTYRDYRITEDGDDLAIRLEMAFRNDVATPEITFGPIDFFDAVSRLYEDGGEGRVVELVFDCTTGASRTERMRRATTDLRVEAYHKAGVEKTDIMPYRIAVRWDDEHGEPEVLLPGQRRMFNLPHGSRLFTAVVRSSTPEGYEFVVGRLSHKMGLSDE